MKQLNKNKKTLVLTLVIVAVIILIGYFTFAYATKTLWPFTPVEKSNATESYSPPTEQEVTDSQDAKKNNSGQEQQEDTSRGQEQIQSVSVAIAYAGFDETENAIDIRAFTPDVIEGDGTCIATLTLNGQAITKSSKGFIDSTTSQCEPILIPVTEFPASGNWDLTVTYTSSKNKGTSASMKVEVKR